MNRLHLARFVAAVAALALGLAACGGDAATSGPTPAQPTVAPATLPPTTAASPVPSTIVPGFSMPSVDKDLEAILPDTIAGEAVTKGSVSGETMVAGQGGEDLKDVLAALDKSPSDLTAAIGSNSKAFFLAFRIKGVEASRFFDAFLDAAADNPAAQLSDVTIAGKQAKKFSDTPGSTTYLYLTGDAIVTVSPIVASDAVLDEIFEQLP